MKVRLDKLVAERFQLSRRAAREAVERGQVDVGGARRIDPAEEIGPDDELSFHPNRPRVDLAERRLTVLYEDRDVMIVDKAPGLLVQPTQLRERDTLLERAGRYQIHKRGVKKPYVGIVHRIDQLTSGVILLVTSPRALRPFQELFRTHTIEREYLAVVEGVFLTPEGSIDLPLVDDAGDNRRGVSREPGVGVPATTHFRVIESYGTVASLVAIRLETGRTHQIRIHLAALDHTVVGDPVYGRRGRPKFPVRFRRQALHAASLGFIHPLSGQSIRVEAPVPTDFTNLTDELKHEYGVIRVDEQG
ncbi:RluA family pseudouridine synthase [Planctomyces sp. SH-PL62]|uniref:RluA family pseudouridine synthase n=1 Tax=Planctomyces sp. SH-PL62 TaxID=1636152 RepID=UPI00078E058C|nr:RluA family pseudouridine synthase [Planctomyces sp. SH-PL62]AMV36108.1 Ribosomal large subunit pseudouridine synthase D [Planctomyces sp. SH-PL62]